MPELPCLLRTPNNRMAQRGTSNEVMSLLSNDRWTTLALFHYHKGPKSALTCVDTVTGLRQAFPNKRANQKATIKGLVELSATSGTPQVTKSDQRTHPISHNIQKWVQDQDLLWIFRLPYNPTTAGL